MFQSRNVSNEGPIVEDLAAKDSEAEGTSIDSWELLWD